VDTVCFEVWGFIYSPLSVICGLSSVAAFNPSSVIGLGDNAEKSDAIMTFELDQPPALHDVDTS
jgi:hypothetical protein